MKKFPVVPFAIALVASLVAMVLQLAIYGAIAALLVWGVGRFVFSAW